LLGLLLSDYSFLLSLSLEVVHLLFEGLHEINYQIMASLEDLELALDGCCGLFDTLIALLFSDKLFFNTLRPAADSPYQLAVIAVFG